MASEISSIPSPVFRQIDKQFLICSICLDRYENPKVLPCLHTFCERWVESLSSDMFYREDSSTFLGDLNIILELMWVLIPQDVALALLFVSSSYVDCFLFLTQKEKLLMCSDVPFTLVAFCITPVLQMFQNSLYQSASVI